MFAVAGAIVSRQEELQNTATPLNLLMIASFFVAFTSSVAGGDNTLAKVSSFLPPVAPLIMPVRIAGGGVALWEIALSLGIMLVSIVAGPAGRPPLRGRHPPHRGQARARDAWRSARRQRPAAAPERRLIPPASHSGKKATPSLVVEQPGVVGQQGDLDPVVEVQLGQELDTWVLTVGTLDAEHGPISALDRPWPTATATSRSRSLSRAGRSLARCGGRGRGRRPGR